MAISVHLISVPAEEVVTSRVVYLPENGGEFGRDQACDIMLPDQKKRISRVHGVIQKTERGYQVKALGKNRSLLNDQPILKEKGYPLNDGDVIKIEDYSLLVSTLTSQSNAELTAPFEDTDDAQFDSAFSVNFDDAEIDFLEEAASITPSKEEASFSHTNVMSDDPFASDPFEDLNSDVIDTFRESDVTESESDDTVIHQAPLEFLPVDGQSSPQLEASINKLISLSEQNQQYLRNPALQHDLLFKALESTLDEFLNEFAPNKLETQFNDYMSSGMFTNKEKKYWRIYRKHFKHRQDNGDFRRQFKALFMENLQKQREEGE